jgi:hypothetical protein
MLKTFIVFLHKRIGNAKTGCWQDSARNARAETHQYLELRNEEISRFLEQKESRKLQVAAIRRVPERQGELLLSPTRRPGQRPSQPLAVND